MFAVIRHTFEMDVTNKYQSSGEWKHKVWLFKSENEAVTYAVSLLDNPVILANEHSLAHAIETLQTGKYWQYGRESIAIGKVEEPKIISEEETDSEKFIH
tara:strand:- start:793 stop:1092 length:300 start_codon:yes stop_codon:yes gene_type:complete